jgi:Skp family chaperone for outer membrane proteins
MQILLILLMAALAEPTTEPTIAKAGPDWVLFIDYPKVFDHLTETKDLRTELEEQRTAMQEKSLELSKQIGQLRKELESLTPDTDEHKKKSQEITAAQQRQKQWEKQQQQTLSNLQGKIMRRLWSQIEAASFEVAAAQKIPVGSKRPLVKLPPATEAVPIDRIRQVILQRQLYRPKDSPDPTALVIEKLESNYSHDKSPTTR